MVAEAMGTQTTSLSVLPSVGRSDLLSGCPRERKKGPPDPPTEALPALSLSPLPSIPTLDQK